MPYNLPRGLLEFGNWWSHQQNGLSEDQVDQTYSPLQFLEEMYCQSSTIIPSEFPVKVFLPLVLQRGPMIFPRGKVVETYCPQFTTLGPNHPLTDTNTMTTGINVVPYNTNIVSHLPDRLTYLDYVSLYY